MSDENFSEEFIRDMEEHEPETMKLNLEDDTPVAEEQSFSLDDVKDEMHDQPEEEQTKEKKEEIVEIPLGKPEVEEEVQEAIPEVEEVYEEPVEEVSYEEKVVEEPKEEQVVVEEDEEEKTSGKKTIFIVLGIVLCVALIATLVIVYATNEAPKITMIHIESDNFDDHTIAKYGNKITLTFSTNEELSGTPKVTINGKEVEVFGEKKEFYAKYFVDNQGMEDVIVSFTIENYKDKLFKKGNPVITTTDNSQVTIKSIIS